MLPLRCFTCNNFIGHTWDEFAKGRTGESKHGKLLDSLKIKRICCRRMLLTHVEIIDDTVMYSNKCTVMDESKTIFDSFVKNSRSTGCD